MPKTSTDFTANDAQAADGGRETVSPRDRNENWFGLGQEFAAAGKLEEAAAAFREAERNDPGNINAPLALGIVLNLAGCHAEARQPLQTVVRRHPGNADACHQLGVACAGIGDAVTAETAFRAALSADPKHFDAYRDLGIFYQNLGRREEAREFLTTARSRSLDDAIVNFHLGSLLNDMGEHDQAVALLQQARARNDSPAIANNLANALMAAGQLVEARIVMDDVLKSNPDFLLGWITLGNVLVKMNRHEQAAEAFAKALSQQPDFPEALLNLAICKHALGDYRNALELFEDFDKRWPDNTTALLGLCKSLQSLGDHKQGLRIAKRLTALRPDVADYWKYQAVSLKQLRHFKKALEAVEQALALNDDDPALHLIAANCHIERKERTRGLASVTAAMERKGSDTMIGHMIGEMLESMKMYQEAMSLYHHILSIDPNNTKAESRILDISLTICEWSSYQEFCQTLIDGIGRDIETDVPLKFDVFNLQALPVDYSFIFRAAKHHSKHIAEISRKRAAPYIHPQRVRNGRPIRVGYVLPYTWVHSLPIVLKEVVEGHDRDRFELIGFCTNLCPGTEFSKSYRASFDRFIDIPREAPQEAARLIHEQEIDVLIDVAGLTGMNCMEIMALRPAPVQAHFLGYSITTGADFIDYLITDRTYIPPEWAEFNTEKLVYLPDTFMAVSHEDAADVKVTRRANKLPKDAFVFANFNHPCKFEPRIFGAWMEILLAVPDSVMWFGAWAPATQKNLRREAEAHGVDGNRLIFSKIVPRDKHLARLQLADLALDNLYHGGGITTVDALWVGLPVLSILGNTPGARLGATLLSAAGQHDMITRDLNHYVETAIALARDSERLATLRDKLKADRDTCALFDMDRYRRNLENAYDAMWRNYEAGHPPAPIDLAVERR